ncbi:CBL-interacting protein kinase 24-like isoform X1 [Lates japonicus]|uniref:non-specific serine/threonine protein kinase n=1 Tax=Lates japonicus TaxID=270547 RepID=A0AAD3N9M6_LATJO|nr:CBL-interacting protein kinase 24-like isoform X1 [Lates japonicus]
MENDSPMWEETTTLSFVSLPTSFTVGSHIGSRILEITTKMGAEQSTLAKHGYVLQSETENAVVATKGDDTFIIKRIILYQISTDVVPALTTEIEILKAISHPHIVNSKHSFKDQGIYYVVMDHCQGGNLAEKIRNRTDSPKESQVLSWIVEICMALKTIHEKGLIHKHLTPESILLTEFGLVCLGDFGKIHENDIWSVGCLLYELCTRKAAFSAETTITLMPKIIGGPYPSLPEMFSPELHQLLSDIFSKDPQSRPTAREILERPFIISCLTAKSKTTVKELQTKLNKLRAVADDLERVHQGATIGSLAGGVIGAVGGVTSIVGLILAPFTLGASLIVTGVGVGVGTLGGFTAGASNITNMVNQSSDRKAIRGIIKEFEQKIKAVVTWLQEISNSLENIRSRCDSAETCDADRQLSLTRLGLRAGRGLGGIAELVRLVQVMNIGRIAAQASRAVRVAEAATGVLSGLFVAVDIFFIAMDAKEIHHIRQAKAAEGATPKSVSETDTDDSVSATDQEAPLTSTMMQELDSHTSQAQDQSARNTTPVQSEVMRFAQSVRQAAHNLQKVLDDLKVIISSIPSLGVERESDWQDMELM